MVKMIAIHLKGIERFYLCSNFVILRAWITFLSLLYLMHVNAEIIEFVYKYKKENKNKKAHNIINQFFHVIIGKENIECIA